MLDYCLSKCREIPYIKGQQRVFSTVTTARGVIIAEGACSYIQTHPKQKEYSLKAGFGERRIYLHSECRVLIQSRGKGSILTIARVGSDGRPLDSCPCISCRLHIADAPWIKQVVFSVGV